MGRREHLRAVLPTVRAQLEGADVCVVVDYSCPQDCGEHVEAYGDERLVVVRHEGAKEFHKTHALNLGLAAAVAQGADFVVQVDADLHLQPGCLDWLRDELEPGLFVIAQNHPGNNGRRAGDGITGFVAVSSLELAEAGGWCERFKGWGCEDYEVRLRLRARGLAFVELPNHYLSPIQHAERDSTRYQHEPKPTSYRRNLGIMRGEIQRFAPEGLETIQDWERLTNR
jgi:glycosyltransferase involved in cell wall biosynthesis